MMKESELWSVTFVVRSKLGRIRKSKCIKDPDSNKPFRGILILKKKNSKCHARLIFQARFPILKCLRHLDS